jgi:hypothetical protein
MMNDDPCKVITDCFLPFLRAGEIQSALILDELSDFAEAMAKRETLQMQDEDVRCRGNGHLFDSLLRFK